MLVVNPNTSLLSLLAASGSIVLAQTCGPNLGSCVAAQCCSPAGYCGIGKDYCAAPDCQFLYGPACDANKVPAGSNTSAIPRPSLGSALYGGAGIQSCVNPGDVALTFDDGPSQYTSHILDILDRYNAKATFFITGINNGKGQIDDAMFPWKADIQRMYVSNHQIASHTWSHANLNTITRDRRFDEMYKNEMALRNIIGVIPTYMRPPYSSCTSETGCEADMATLGYHIVYFDMDTQDYLNDSPTLIGKSKSIFETAISNKSPSNPGPLVIGHDIHQETSEQLTEYMLQTLQAKGFRAVTVGTCLGDNQMNWYRPDRSTLGMRGMRGMRSTTW